MWKSGMCICHVSQYILTWRMTQSKVSHFFLQSQNYWWWYEHRKQKKKVYMRTEMYLQLIYSEFNRTKRTVYISLIKIHVSLKEHLSAFKWSYFILFIVVTWSPMCTKTSTELVWEEKQNSTDGTKSVFNFRILILQSINICVSLNDFVTFYLTQIYRV